MPNIEIVTHCWSGDKVSIYHRLLQYQLSSILQYEYLKDFSAQITVCFSYDDTRTADVLGYFLPRFNAHRNIIFDPIGLSESNLFRRAIGRNRAALSSKADVVWFTDCDHIFGEHSLYSAWMASRIIKTNMVHPEHVYINTNHGYGDDLIKYSDNKVMAILPINYSRGFTQRKEKRAWGGLQIVTGDYAREHGYLNRTDWINPVSEALGFKSCKCDVPYRKAAGGSTAVPIT